LTILAQQQVSLSTIPCLHAEGLQDAPTKCHRSLRNFKSDARKQKAEGRKQKAEERKN
jgi:hypothetical protein